MVRIWFRSYLHGLVVFPYFLQFTSEFGNKEFKIWATVSSWSCFCWLYRASPSSAAKNIIGLISVLTIWWCPCVESSLVLLEEGVCYDQCVLLAKLCWPCPASFCYTYLFNFNDGKNSLQCTNNSICLWNALLNEFQKYFSKIKNISYLSESQKMLSMFQNKNPNKNTPKDV